MGYNPKDHYFKKAKQENFAARSVFKLSEMDERFHILRTGDWVLDLGASPGSWSQYASQKVGGKGRILGIDLSPVTVKLDNALFLQNDIRDVRMQEILQANGFDREFDVVLSDMAPKTTGIKVTDQARSMALCEMAVEIADKYLRKGGQFACKLFHSDDFKELREMLRLRFNRVEAIKPKSTRSMSKEIFLLGLGKK